DKSSASETYDFASCVSSPKTNDSFSTVDVKILPKSDVKDPSLTNGFPTSVPAGSRNSSASTSTGRFIPAASGNRPASIHAGRHIPAGMFNKPAPFPAGRSVPTGWTNHAARSFLDQQTCILIVHPHVNKDIGIIDSGCSRSMTGNKEKLDDFMQIKGDTVTFGGGDDKITRKGTIRTSKLNFENVYYVDELQNFNLFSVSQICDKKNKVIFTDAECLVLTKEFQLPDESQVVLRIPRRHDLYTFNLSDIQPEQQINCLLAKASLEESTKWHRRMAHVNFKTINKLAKNGLVEDLFGPTSIRSIDHKYYSLVVTDDFSRFSWAFFLGTKDETFYILKDFIALIENQLNKKVKAIRVSITNPHNKTPYELLSGKVPNIQHLKPFRCQVTILNISDHLGKFEGKANDDFLVGYVAHSKAYRVYNLSSKKVEKTLNLRYLEDKPSVQGLGQEWYFDLNYLTDSLGYTRFKTNPPTGTQDTNIIAGSKVNDVFAPMKTNLDYAKKLARLQKQEYEAHSATTKYGFEFSNETAEMLHQADIETCRNLVLDAGDPAGSIVSTGGVPAGSIPAGSVPASHVPTSSVPAGSVPAGHVPASSIPAGGVFAGSIDSAGFDDPAASESVPAVFTTDHDATSTLPPGHSLGSSEHSTQFPSPSDLGNHQPTADIFSSSSYDDDFCADVTNLASNVAVDPVATKRVNAIHPQSHIIRELYVAKALEDPNWVAAMQEEMQQFYNQQVFVPVARIEAIRLFLAFASYMGFMVYQMDVKSAFLYEKIDEEMYVTQPKGFEDPHNPKHVYRVVIALYGLHQAPRAWYARLSTFLLKHHYKRGTIDKTLFFKKDSRHIILVQVYVDDIIFGSTNQAWCDEFEVLMEGEFEISAMDELTFFLGLQVKQLPDGIFISQDKYVKDMLKKFDMESVRTVTTPYEVPKPKSKDEPDDVVNVHLYRSMIGSLMMTAVSCGFLLYAVQIVGMPPILLVVPVFLLVVLVHADGWVSAGRCTISTSSCTIPTGSGTIPTGSGTISTGSCTLPTGSYSFMLLDWFLLATATVRTLEAGPSEIIATIDGNAVVVTESLIRTQLQLNDANGLYEFTLHDVLDGIREIWYPTDGSLTFYKAKLSPQWRFLIHTFIHCMSPKSGGGISSLDGPPMPLLAPMLVVPAGGDGADAAAANEISPPPPPPHVPLTHTSSSTPGPSLAAQDTPIREPTPVREPTPSPMRGPIPFQEPTPDSPRPHSPLLYPRLEEVSPTTSTRPPSQTRQTSFQEDVSEGGGDYISSPKSDEAPPTTAATAAGGAEDSAALTALSLTLDRCINRVTSLENELGITKKVLGGAVLKLVTRVKRLEGLLQQRKRRLEAIQLLRLLTPSIKLPKMLMPPQMLVIMKIRPFAGSTPIPSSGGVSAGSSMDLAGQAAAAAAPSSTISAADKGKAPMVDDSLPADLLSEQERILKNLYDYQLREDLAKKIHTEQEAEFARKQEELA
nr:retrovirus-related Pol polyprotein from transposon TNT 1-94 [Tanacetum cinerariifolium]